MEIKEELVHYKKTHRPRCITCKKSFKKIKERTSKFHEVWESDCDCHEPVNICIG